jgi:hypothetical protein
LNAGRRARPSYIAAVTRPGATAAAVASAAVFTEPLLVLPDTSKTFTRSITEYSRAGRPGVTGDMRAVT